MGQAQGLLPTEVVSAQNYIHRHALELKLAASMNHDVFLKSIKQLNEIAAKFGDVRGKSLMFHVKKGSDTTFLWRGTVRINCHKINTQTRRIDSTRVLNLKEYIHLHNLIVNQSSQGLLEPIMSASTYLNKMDECETVECGECCICMERSAHLILSCSHTYCEKCIDEWGETHTTCPLCRAEIGRAEESWILTERPDNSQIANEATDYVLEVADRSGYAEVKKE